MKDLNNFATFQLFYKQMWTKLFMGDNNSNNIAIFFKIVQNHIEEKKTYNFSKVEHIFYTIKKYLLDI